MISENKDGKHKKKKKELLHFDRNLFMSNVSTKRSREKKNEETSH